MYSSAFDPENALLVARLAAGGDEAQDFPDHIERMLTASAATRDNEHTLCILAILDCTHALPSPSVRKQVSEAISRPDFRPHLAIVTKNPLVRGVLTALTWLGNPGFEINLVSEPGEAVAWMEGQRGTPLPKLLELLAQVT